jgi:hypothetical protein
MTSIDDLREVRLQISAIALVGQDHLQEASIPLPTVKDDLPLEVLLETQTANWDIPDMLQIHLPQSFQNIDVQGRRKKQLYWLPKDVILRKLDLVIKIIPLKRKNPTETQ